MPCKSIDCLSDETLDKMMETENPLYLMILAHKPRFAWFSVWLYIIAVVLLLTIFVFDPIVEIWALIAACSIITLSAGSLTWHIFKYNKWEKKIREEYFDQDESQIN